MNNLDVLIYLDDILIKGISSLLVDGYIEIKSCKKTFDRTLYGRVCCGDKESNTSEDRRTKTKKEGFKDRSLSDGCTYTLGSTHDKVVEDRGYQKIEEEIKKISTSFMFHRDVIQHLTNNNYIKPSQNYYDIQSLNDGDYIELYGCIKCESINCYIENLCTLIKCIGTEKLNTLLPKESFLNFDNVFSILNELNNKLSTSNTCDIILLCGDTEAVLTVNNNYFENLNGNKFDIVNCNCRVIGKVVKSCCGNNDRIELLRKTGQQEFYENLLDICTPILKYIEKLGIKLPERPRCCISKSGIQIVPISIYI